ncbi:MAG: hypothetical protein HY320_01700 [Armatimonadetes bacterium]|nr:hypothetical protein [Armatimonadota bacterium]
MFLRRNFRQRGGKLHAYWTLVESHRTECGPRQRIVAYLGDLEEAAREAACSAALDRSGAMLHDLIGHINTAVTNTDSACMQK